MTISQARARRISSINPKEFDLHDLLLQNEQDLKYPRWATWREFVDLLVSLPESVMWHVFLCILTLLAILILSMDYETSPGEDVFGLPISDVIDITYNALYGLHAIAHMINDCYRVHHEKHEISRQYWMWYILDATTYVHYGMTLLASNEYVVDIPYAVKMACYYIRLRRPLYYLWKMNSYYLKGSVFSTSLKYWYIFVMLRVVYSNAFIWLGMTQVIKYSHVPHWLKKKRASLFYRTFYMMDKRFLPIGLDWPPDTDLGRLATLVVMMSGALMVTGVACASLAIIMSVHLRPEEMFRSRFRLITNAMIECSVPIQLRQKVEAYYNMYWHKQKAVTVTQLLPTYPPTLISTLQMDIYFEAFQKSHILRDLSYQFLSEVAKYMRTVTYIPGDVIIERNIGKFVIVYIAYGDVEVMTAEDNVTPMLRLTRGSILNPCGACVDVACCAAHASVHAATFCVAHVLHVADFWRVASVHGKRNMQSYVIHASFQEHIDKVMLHFLHRPRRKQENKSSVLSLKRNLIELQEGKDEEGKPLMGNTDALVEIAGCYIMRNQPYASLMDQSDAICLKSTFPCILQPSSSLQIAWKLFVTVVALTAAIVHPYYIVFTHRHSVNFNFFDFVVNVINLLDIIVHLSTGVNVEEGVPVNFTKSSSQQMQSIWFILDVLSVAPIFYFVEDGQFSGMNKIFKLPKVFRTLKEMEQVCVYHIHLLRFFSVCIMMIIVNWLVAALNYSILCFKFNYCYVGSLVEMPYVSMQRIPNRTHSDLMLFNLYWTISITTLTTHLTHTISRENWQVQALVMVILEVCAALHVVIKAAYSATNMVTESMREDYNECIETVTQFLERNYVDPVLRDRFENYLQLCWYTNKAYGLTHEDRSILYDLPRHVYEDIASIQRNKYLHCIPFMKALPPSMLKAISSYAHLFYTSPNEILLNTGDMSNEIYVIKQGFCEVVDPITKKIVSIITTKSHFSDLECLIRVPVYYTVRALTHVQVFTISRKYMLKAISLPRLKEVIAYAKSQPEYHKLMRQRCEQFMKYEKPPPAPNREVFPLLRKHESDEAYLLPFQRLGFFAIFKYIFPRFTIRPDGQYLRRYEWFRAFCAFLSAFIPSAGVMTLQFPWIYYITFALDFSAYFDLIQRMLVGYFDDKGILIYHPASTAAYYFRGAFIVDLLACLPLEHLASIDMHINDVNGVHLHKVPKAMQYMVFNRCLQLYRLPRALDFLHNYTTRRDIVYIIKTIPILMVFINAIGTFCIIDSVKQFIDGKKWHFMIPNSRFPSWIKTDGPNVGYNVTGTPFNLWLTTFYWSTYQITTAGFDLFKPHTHSLILTFIVGMTIGMMLTKYISVRVLCIRSNVNQGLAKFQGNIKDIITFMKRERFNKDLQKEVLSYYEYTWEKTGGTDYRSVFKLCDQITLRTDAILHIYGKTFQKCPILYQSDLSLLRLLGRAAHSVYFCPGTIMIERDDVITELYFIDFGTVEVRDSEDDDHIVTELPRGSLFGNLDNVNRVVCPNEFVVHSNVHLLKMDATLFYNILRDFPAIRERMMQYRPEDENYIIGDQHTKSVAVSAWKKWAASSLMLFTQRSVALKNLLNHSKLIQIYLILVSLICVILDVYNASFKHNGKHLIRTFYVLDVAFALKIVLNILIPYIKSQVSESEVAIRTLQRKYFLGEFKYDIISLLPLELFCLLATDKWQVFPYLRLNRFFRTVTIQSCLTRYKRRLTINLPGVTMASLFIWFILFVHTTTCLWHIIGVFEDYRRPRSSWRWNRTNQYICFKSRYICSMYFVVTTFTQNGAGDILPRQQSEVVFVCALMILSTMMYMVYVGEFANIIHYQFYHLLTFYGKYLELKEFLKNNRVAKNLVTLTKKYTLHLWREARGQQLPHFVKTAPECLRLKIMTNAYMKHLRKIPAFKHCETPFLRQLVGHLQPFYYDDNMYVVREGEITNSMYFIHHGRVQELNEAQDLETEVFEAKTHFGTVQGLFRDTPYMFSYKTKIKSQVLTLNLNSWEYLLVHFPNNMDIISRYYTGPTPKKRGESLKPVSLEASPIHSTKRVSRLVKYEPPKQKEKKEQEPPKPFIEDMPRKEPEAEFKPLMQDSVSPWPLNSRMRSSLFSPSAYSYDGSRKSSVFRQKSIAWGQEADQSTSKSKVTESQPKEPKSRGSMFKKILSRKSIDKGKSLLAPPHDRSDTDLAALHAESQLIDPSPIKDAKDRTMSKAIKIKTEPDQFNITPTSEEEKVPRERMSRSVSIQSVMKDQSKKVRISELKGKRSTLTFKDTILTAEAPELDTGEEIEEEKEEARTIAGVLSAMSLHSLGDVEEFMMEQNSTTSSKLKQDSKEKQIDKRK